MEIYDDSASAEISKKTKARRKFFSSFFIVTFLSHTWGHQMALNISRLKCNQSGILWSNNCKDGTDEAGEQAVEEKVARWEREKGGNNQKPLSNMNFYHVTFSGWLGSTNFLLFPLLSALVLAGEVSACNFQEIISFSREIYSFSRQKKTKRNPLKTIFPCRFCVS